MIIAKRRVVEAPKASSVVVSGRGVPSSAEEGVGGGEGHKLPS